MATTRSTGTQTNPPASTAPQGEMWNIYNQKSDVKGDIFDGLTGTTGGMDKNVQYVNNEWQIMNDGKWENLEKYMNTQDKCEQIGAPKGSDENACFNLAKDLFSPNGYKNILADVDNIGVLNDLADTFNKKNSHDKLKKMTPFAVFYALKGLYFRGVQDENGHVTVEHPGEWYNRFKAHGLKDDNGNIVDINRDVRDTLTEGYKNNGSLKQLLTNFVNYVNSNPDILNGKGTKFVRVNTSDPYGLKPARGQKPDPASVFHDAKVVIGNTALHHQLALDSVLLGALPMAYHAVQTGGATAAQVRRHFVNFNEKVPHIPLYSEMLKKIYDSLNGKLQALGKKLNNDTSSKINTLFATLENSEKDLLNRMKHLHAYIQEAKADPNKIIQGDLSGDEITKAYKEYSKRIKKNERRGKNIIDILRTIANGVDEIQGNKVSLHMQA